MVNSIKICSVTKKYHSQLLAVVKEVIVNGYTLYVYPKPYKSQVWRIFTDNKKFIAGNCVDYNLKSKTMKKAEFQNCVECLSISIPHNFEILLSSWFYQGNGDNYPHFLGLID